MAKFGKQHPGHSCVFDNERSTRLRQFNFLKLLIDSKKIIKRGKSSLIAIIKNLSYYQRSGKRPF
jgi:hypothetical protein